MGVEISYMVLEEYTRELESKNSKLIKENLNLKRQIELLCDTIRGYEQEKVEMIDAVGLLVRKFGYEISPVESEG